MVFIVFSIISCQKTHHDEPGDGFQDLSANFIGESLPVLATTLSENIDLLNFSVLEEEKMKEAIEIIKLVVATDEFRQRVLNHTFNGQKTFVDNGGRTNAQIYQIILEAAEKLQPAKNNTIDAEVELYYEANSIVGYTYVATRRIWVNTKYFNNYTAAGVAHNLFHEWMHKLGFNHASTWSIQRDYSVPYALGYLIGQLGNDFL